MMSASCKLYLSDHFTNQIKPSYACLNIHGGTARKLYNAQWIVEKNGYLSPAQA